MDVNAYLQVGLGLIPGAIAAIVLLIKRRAFHFRGIFVTLLLTAVCVSAIVYGAKSASQSSQHKAGQLTQEKMISFANALGQGGAYDAVIMDKPVADNYVAAGGYKILEGTLLDEQNYVIAKEGNDELMNAVNEAIKAFLESDDCAALQEKYGL